MHFNAPNNYSAMDREYAANSGLEPAGEYFGNQDFGDIQHAAMPGFAGGTEGGGEKPLFTVNELGQTVPEGKQFGTFIESMQGAIRAGAGTVELALDLGDVRTGPEAYGKEARTALRELSQTNEVKVTTVHTPTQVGNLSGYTGPERGFNDEQRKVFVDEVKRAINFIADISPTGGAVVVHTGEFQRPISEQPWAQWKDEKGQTHYHFKGYEEEPEKAIIPVVDDRTGQVMTVVRKNQEVPRAVWNRYEAENTTAPWQDHHGKAYYDSKGNLVQPDDYINYDGNKIDRKDRMPRYNPKEGKFDVRVLHWQDFVREAEELNAEEERKLGRPLREHEKLLPEEAFLRATTETQMKIAQGWAGIYAQTLEEDFEALKKMKQALTFYEKLESNIPEDEKWRLKKVDIPRALHGLTDLIPPESKNPTEVLRNAIKNTEHNIFNHREAVVGQTQSAMEQQILQNHAQSATRYAKKKSVSSYAEAALYAYDQTREKQLEKPVFLAPENLWPEMGWGTHPRELRDLVVGARQEMADRLVKDRGIAASEARQIAAEHIKTTIDFQHLGMWWKHFEPAYPGEPETEKKRRFDAWFMKEFKSLVDEGLVGNLHIVDGMGGAHHHLPPGQGVFPIKTALEYLKEKGYTGSYNSEGWGEGPARQLAKTWEYMGAWTRPTGLVGPMGPGVQQRWTDVFQSYFGRTYPPNYIFGNYAPSNDWTLWSQVPME